MTAQKFVLAMMFVSGSLIACDVPIQDRVSEADIERQFISPEFQEVPCGPECSEEPSEAE
jgi:hypothetical protein